MQEDYRITGQTLCVPECLGLGVTFQIVGFCVPISVCIGFCLYLSVGGWVSPISLGDNLFCRFETLCPLSGRLQQQHTGLGIACLSVLQSPRVFFTLFSSLRFFKVRSKWCIIYRLLSIRRMKQRSPWQQMGNFF